MSITNVFPFQLHWTSQELAEAVPLRLFELLDFDVHRDNPGMASANVMPRPQRAWLRCGYVRATELPAFIRVRG